MFKKLKSLFIEEDETNPSKKTGTKSKPTATSKPQSQQTKSVPRPSIPVPPSTGGKPAEKFVDKLLKAIEKNNLDGFDYLEFKQSLQSLSNVDMDEKTRFQSAMAMAKTMGATEDKIINAAQHYLNILKDEQQKFEVAFKAQETKQVSLRQQTIDRSEKAIVDKKAKIEQLKKEIESLNATVNKSKEETNKATAKVAATKDGFYNAYHSVVKQIKSDISAMQNHLK